MKTHLQKRIKNNKEPFDIRIGIHTGPVVAGIVGIKKFAYDIWGDTVNIASRMESSGEAGKVNISGSTFELVKEKYNGFCFLLVADWGTLFYDLLYIPVNTFSLAGCLPLSLQLLLLLLQNSTRLSSSGQHNMMAAESINQLLQQKVKFICSNIPVF